MLVEHLTIYLQPGQPKILKWAFIVGIKVYIMGGYGVLDSQVGGSDIACLVYLLQEKGKC